MTWIQKSLEFSSIHTFPKVPELASILTCDLEKSKQANLAKNTLGGSGEGAALISTDTKHQEIPM